MNKLIALIAVVGMCLSMSVFKAEAQTTLFAYPTAPDTCRTLETRCNYLVQRFWNGCDLSKPVKAENDSLLLMAVRDYLEIMMNANVNVSLASVRNLMFKAQSNQTNFLKLAQAAEMLLYMQPTTVIDDVYLAFAKSVADATGVDKEVRNHFRRQVKLIEASKLTAPIVDFEFAELGGGKRHLYDKADTCANYLLLFSRDDSDGSFARLRLSTDAGINAAIASGKLKVIDLTIDRTSSDWAKESADYAQSWTVGNYQNAANEIDLRRMPCVFLLDAQHRVLSKNLSVDQVKEMFN